MVLTLYLALMTTGLLVPGEFLSRWLWGTDVLTGGAGSVDKIVHAVAFAGLTVLSLWSMMPRPSRGYWLAIITLVVAYALVSEMLQGMTGYREADVWDLLADLVGLAIGMLVGVLLWRDEPLAT